MLNLPATLLLTESRLYVSEPSCVDAPLTHWPLAALERAVRRRHLLRPVGLELQFRRGSGADGGRSDGGASTRLTPDDPETLLVALPTAAARDQLYEAVHRAAASARGRPLPPPPESQLAEMMARWRHGLIDNFTYLLFLNDCAGRSLSDLAQYPVFPWVLADLSSAALDLDAPASYRDLSKPIGALSEKRCALFRERCESMEPAQRFMYGTHYSAPGFVAFFLLRHAPELTLHLHSGRFDEPDRQFTSVAEAWVCRAPPAHSVLRPLCFPPRHHRATTAPPLPFPPRHPSLSRRATPPFPTAPPLPFPPRHPSLSRRATPRRPRRSPPAPT